MASMRRDKKRTDNFPHERTDKLLDELEAENKRLREALIKIRSPHVSDPAPKNIAREALK